MTEDNKNKFENFLAINLSSYLNKEWVVINKSFQSSILNLQNNVKILLDDSIRSILNYNEFIPEKLEIGLNEYVNNIININDKLSSYNYEKDEPGNFRNRQQIIDSMNVLVDYAYSNHFDGGRNNNLLILYSTIKSYVSNPNFNNEELNNYKAELESLKSQSLAYNEEMKSMVNIMRDTLTKEAVEEYSTIFENQSYKNSHIKFWSIGSAERWLMLGSILLVIFIIIVFNPQYYLIQGDFKDVGYLNIISKLSIYIILIFAISFSFKQFSVNKHLFTLNKHRANALNTYKLFSKSVGNEDLTTKYAITLEVAKAIFDHNKSGYIGSKESDMSGPSFIEMVKFINTNKT